MAKMTYKGAGYFDFDGEIIHAPQLIDRYNGYVEKLREALRLILDSAENDVDDGRGEGTSLYGIEALARAALAENLEHEDTNDKDKRA